jgi:hypothetical protein
MVKHIPISNDDDTAISDSEADVISPDSPKPSENEVQPDVSSDLPASPAEESQPLSSSEQTPNETAVAPKKTPFIVRCLSWPFHFRPRYIWPKFFRTKLGKAAGPLGVVVILILLSGVALGAAALKVHDKNTRSSGVRSELTYTAVKFFRVESSQPADNAQSVDDSSNITIDFNQPVSATKLVNSFNITPSTKGSLVQGDNANQVIFKPDAAFSDSTKVIIMIDRNFESQLGYKLTGDYMLNFTTDTPTNGVEFSNQYTFYNLLSAQSNTPQQLTLNVGSQVDPNGQIIVYKASIAPLLASFEYKQVPYIGGGGSYDSPILPTINTSTMQQLTMKAGLTDQATYTINEPEGIYLVVADSYGQQVGWTWVVFNDNGTIMRQDDQQIVLSAFNLTDNSIPTDSDVSFYNLDNHVKLLDQGSLSSPQSYSFPYSEQVDIAVVTVGSDTMVVPITVPNSLADARVTKNLATTRDFYALTDKPTYQVGDKVQFAGFENLDQDATFPADTEGSVQLYIANQNTPTQSIEELTEPVTSSGQFSGSFTLGSSDFSDQNSYGIYAYSDTTIPVADQYPTNLASFTIADSQSKDTLKVSFAKTDYLPSDTIAATITGTDSSGQPLANTTVTYNVTSLPYYENNPTSNLASFGEQGENVGAQNQTVQLNSSGQAVVPINPSDLQLGLNGSQIVNLQASLVDSSGITAGAGATTIVHQGNMIIQFGTGKTYFNTDDTRFGRVYVTDLKNNPLPNTPVSYQFLYYTYNQTTGVSTPNVLASGSGTTDSNGYLYVSQQLNTTQPVVIVATATDSDGNQVSSELDTETTEADSGPVMAGADSLDYLDVSGSNGQLTVGDQASLTITAPQNMTVLVSYERGRIYSYKTLQLSKGTNNYTLNVTAQMAPSFNLVFSYFIDGMYHEEGTQFTVTNPADKLTVSAVPDQTSYTANQTASIKISTTDGNGAAVAANLIVAVESDSMFNLNSSFVPDMYSYYYATREYSTNSSSSLTGIGSGGGGKCGGGGFSNSGLLNNTGTTLYWNPEASTDSTGTTTISVPMPAGTWHIMVYAMSGAAAVGDTQTIVTAQ